MNKEQQALICLLRQSFWGQRQALPENVDWEQVSKLARSQGVVTFAYDGAAMRKDEVPGQCLNAWMQTILGGVVNNERLLRAQDELVHFFADAGIPCVILKGTSVSRYYPQPNLRALGDIDVLVDKTQVQKARDLLEKHGFAAVESDHDFHIGFRRSGVSVELHYAVTTLPDGTGADETRKVTERFLDQAVQGSMENFTFPVLSEPHQAVMLLLHMIRHMFSSGIGLRQLCDWSMYIRATDSDVFTMETIPLLKKCGLMHYAKVVTRVCVKYLGQPEDELSWCEDIDGELCRIFLEDVLKKGNMGRSNEEILNGLFVGASAGENKSPFWAMFERLNLLAYRSFPFTKKYKILLPFFWVYLPVRYFVRAFLGTRPRRSIKKTLEAAKQTRSLHDSMNLFDSEK